MTTRLLYLALLAGIFATILSPEAAAVGCPDYTNRSTCDNVTGCWWRNEPWGQFCEMRGCWNFNNETACDDSYSVISENCLWETGDDWGWCEQQGCWSFFIESSCTNSSDNVTCSWANYSEGPSSGYCYMQEGCESIANESGCAGKTGYGGRPCRWTNNTRSCYEQNCPRFDGNQTGCEATTRCAWNDPFCQDRGCWSISNQTGCAADGCNWRIQEAWGWCMKPGCWNWDNTNQTACETETPAYNLSCQYDASGSYDPCYSNQTFACSNFNDEIGCINTWFCHWNPGNTSCVEPEFNSYFQVWNPGCYIFDQDSRACNATLGCRYNTSTSLCDKNGTNPEGIVCTNVTNSSLCNEIPMLGTCCQWSAGNCSVDYSPNCWEQMDTPPDGAAFCEDYNSFDNQQLCQQIAGFPWYMPCRWDNTSERCQFNGAQVFSDREGEGGCGEIDNRQTCEFAGCNWMQDSYCQNNISIQAGRCERKFNEERNCERACFACERTANGTAWGSATEARTACENSDESCEFQADSHSPNGWVCRKKAAFRTGQAGDCHSDCAGCTFKNNAQVACDDSRANCKWDATTNACIPESQRTCEQACDRCFSSTNCVTNGRGTQGACRWDDAQGLCLASSGSQEVCFNGADDDNDGNVDCADSGCYTDPSCGTGGGDDANCFAYATGATCNATAGCAWIEDQWGGWCDMEEALCWEASGNEPECTQLNESCVWHQSAAGGQCDVNWDTGGECVELDDDGETICEQNVNCTWVTDPWCNDPRNANTEYCQTMGGWCDLTALAGGEDCFSSNTQQACDALANCRWQFDFFNPDMGWCQPDFPCMNDTLRNDQDACTAEPICRWLGGFCDPIGFVNQQVGGGGGGGGFGGSNCFQYNGNQTGCQNQSSCEWFPAPMGGFCDMNQRCRDPTLIFNQTLCQLAGCAYQATPWMECFSPAEACFRNQTLQDNESECHTNARCRWSNMSFGPPGQEPMEGAGHCEPGCFNYTSAGTCGGDSACRWATGFCGDAGAVDTFQHAEGGEPIMLGFDANDTTAPDYADILGFGVKDIPTPQGKVMAVGAQMDSLVQSYYCNGQPLAGRQGSGTQTTKYFVYLDSDGSTASGCPLKHDSSNAAGNSDGYEFFFSLVVNSSGTTLVAQRCLDDGSAETWVASDVAINTFAAFSCNIGVIMISIPTGDLARFGDEFFSTEVDYRISVAAADGTGGARAPNDTAGPGYLTPGAADFAIGGGGGGLDSGELDDHFAQYGFAKFEDCFTAEGETAADEDLDGAIDCDDYHCAGYPHCDGIGVNHPDFVDTRMPTIIPGSSDVEEFTDAAHFTANTNKPANETIYFYGNDSQCSVLNKTIVGNGKFQLFHDIIIGNLTNVSNLTPDTAFFYKVEFCDEGGKCSRSKCENFTTSPANDCPGCDFIVNFDEPDADGDGTPEYQILLDVDRDGDWDFSPGDACTPNAGYLLNYNDALTGVDIYISPTNNTNDSILTLTDVIITEDNANSKVRDLSSTSEGGEAFIEQTVEQTDGTDLEIVGMDAEIRDKLVNVFHPETCQIQMGKGDLASCGTHPYHCADDGTECVEDADANLTNETDTTCIYTSTDCLFSTYSAGNVQAGAGSTSGRSSRSGGGSGSGGGGGGSAMGMAGVKVLKVATYSGLTASAKVTVKVPSELAEVSFISVEDAKTAKLTVSQVTRLPPNIPPLAGATATWKIDHSGFGKVKSVTLKVKAAPDSLLWRYFGETWTALRGGAQEGEHRVFYSPGFSYFALTGQAPEAITGAAVTETPPVTEFQPSAPTAPAGAQPQAPSTYTPRQEAPTGQAYKARMPATGTFLVITGAVIAALAIFGLLVSRRKPKAPA